MHRERGNVWVIILGIVMILFLIGFFRSERSFWDTVNFKQILRLSCGLTVKHPADNLKASFPLFVDGYENDCGWSPNGNNAGTAQIFDGTGLPVTKPVPLVVAADSTTSPYYFSAYLVLNAAPHTDTGNLLLRSATGLLHSVPVTF